MLIPVGEDANRGTPNPLACAYVLMVRSCYMFYSIIQQKTQTVDCLRVLSGFTIDTGYIRQRGMLREPQIAAIETYLFLKIEGRGRPLAKLFADGFFNQQEDLGALRISQIARDRLSRPIHRHWPFSSFAPHWKRRKVHRTGAWRKHSSGI
jgi:hypothetical protein